MSVQSSCTHHVFNVHFSGTREPEVGAGGGGGHQKPCGIIIIALIRPGKVSQEMDTANVIAHDTPEEH